MPLVSCANVLRSDEDLLLSLSLRITHILSISSSLDLEPAEDDMPPLPVRGDTLSALDVFISGPLKIHISGSMDGRKVSPKAIAESWLANSMAFALRRNASTLGIHDVSDVFLDDKAATILVTTKGAFTSPFDIAGNMPPVALKRFELRVHCGSKTNLPEDTNAGSHGTGVGHSSQHPSILLPSPFSPTPLASYKEAWAKLTDKFLINNMLRRYPLIFGEWKQVALESEQAFFPSIARSISNMFIRSPNPSFKLAGQNAFLDIRAQNDAVSDAAWDILKSIRKRSGEPLLNVENAQAVILSRRPGATGAGKEDSAQEFVEVICVALTRMYRTCKPPPRARFFKLIASDDSDSIPPQEVAPSSTQPPSLDSPAHQYTAGAGAASLRNALTLEGNIYALSSSPVTDLALLAHPYPQPPNFNINDETSMLFDPTLQLATLLPLSLHTPLQIPSLVFDLEDEDDGDDNEEDIAEDDNLLLIDDHDDLIGLSTDPDSSSAHPHVMINSYETYPELDGPAYPHLQIESPPWIESPYNLHLSGSFMLRESGELELGKGRFIHSEAEEIDDDELMIDNDEFW